MNAMLQDMRYAIRGLRKTPLFSIGVVVTLALGIGANTAIFSVVKGVLLAPLPYPEPDRVVMVWETRAAQGRDRNVVNPQNYLDWRARSRSFAALGLYTWRTMTLTGGGQPENVSGRAVTPNVFDILGVRPAIGRAFAPEEGTPGSASLVVLSDALWRRRFGADPGVVGRNITVSGGSALVIGVMPASFRPLGNEEYWEPLRLDPADRQHNGRYAMSIGRLRDGVTREQAQAEMTTIARQLEAEYPAFDTGWGARVAALKDDLIGSARGVLWMLLGAVGVVLLITCANVGNLMLVRAASRGRELAVRTALGAPGWRLLRQWLLENVVLSLAGGAVGVLIASYGIDLLLALHPDSVPRLSEIALDRGVVVVTLILSLGVGVMIGLPALAGGRFDRIADALRSAGSRSTAGSRAAAFRAALVVAQVSLALVLLIGAGLMMRSVARLAAVDPGFNPDQVVTTTIDLPSAKYPVDSGRVTAFYQRLLERVRAIPGVQHASIASWVPVSGIGAATGFTVVGRPAPANGAGPSAVIRVVDPDYFATMRLPLVRGRAFTERDDAQGLPVVIISAALARRTWPGEEAIGRKVQVSWWHPEQQAEVVGVVGDVLDTGLDGEHNPTIYYPAPQSPSGYMSVVIRSTLPAAALAPAVRAAVRDIDPDLPVRALRTMATVVTESMADRRYPTILLEIFAGVALLVAAIGVYAVLAFTVSLRTREIGVRMALGAQRGQVMAMMLRDGLRLTGIGVVLGAIAGAMASRALSGLLFHVAPADPLTIGIVALVLVATSTAATFLPARRATRIDPMVALRTD